ncbi:hypothetical protein HYV44_00935 [Candidatus Microgenomates bacterium]|nr:hypothetical protein [Candidatus Microgenomates bacterium]
MNQKQKINRREKQNITELTEETSFAEYVNFIKSPWKTFLFSFLRGTAFGLGTIIGVALVVTILTYIIRSFGGVPVIGEWLVKLGEASKLQ